MTIIIPWFVPPAILIVISLFLALWWAELTKWEKSDFHKRVGSHVGFVAWCLFFVGLFVLVGGWWRGLFFNP